MAPLSSRDDFVWVPQELAALPGWREISRPRVAGFCRIVTDSRDADRGALFVALRGQRHDGHDFVAEAVARGAAGVVVERVPSVPLPDGVGLFHVRNTIEALGQLAWMKRRAYRGTVVALTGSMGKTTTKHFVSQLAGRSVSVTTGNFNNQIGVPLSIFAASLKARAWILELGMNAPGEIAALTRVARPDIGVLLPAGRAHLGGFADQSEIVAAKAEMVRVAEAPRRVLTVGPQYDELISEGVEHERIGPSGAYDVRPGQIVFPSGTRFEVADHGTRIRRTVPVHGAHFATNLAAAWAISRVCGFRRHTLADRLTTLETPPGRMRLHALRGGWLLDDSYNASPESFLAFAAFLSQLPSPVRLVVADMRELGDRSEPLHEEVAQALLGLPLRRVIAIRGQLADALQRAGCSVHIVDTGEEAIEAGLEAWRPGAVVAVKGAHGSGLYAALRRRGF